MAVREYPRWVHHPKYTEPSLIVRNADEERTALARWGVIFEPEDTPIKPNGVLPTVPAIVPAAPPPPPDPREKLRREAEAMGIEPDGRWSARRLQEEIDRKISELQNAAMALKQPDLHPDDITMEQ